MAQRKCLIEALRSPWYQSWIVLLGAPINSPKSFCINSSPGGRSALSKAFFNCLITSFAVFG